MSYAFEYCEEGKEIEQQKHQQFRKPLFPTKSKQQQDEEKEYERIFDKLKSDGKIKVISMPGYDPFLDK